MLSINKIAKLSHVSYEVKKFLQFYPWKNCKPSFSYQLKKQLNECKVAIVSSAGFIVNKKQKVLNMRTTNDTYAYVYI